MPSKVAVVCDPAELEMLTALPVVSELEVTLRAAPLVVFTDVSCSKLPAPVVLLPVKLTVLPVKPVVVPDWVTLSKVAVVWAAAELEILTPVPVVSELEVTFKALPFVVFTEVRLKRLPVPVVLEPVKSTVLPVKPVVVPDWTTFSTEAVV